MGTCSATSLKESYLGSFFLFDLLNRTGAGISSTVKLFIFLGFVVSDLSGRITAVISNSFASSPVKSTSNALSVVSIEHGAPEMVIVDNRESRFSNFEAQSSADETCRFSKGSWPQSLVGISCRLRMKYVYILGAM